MQIEDSLQYLPEIQSQDQFEPIGQTWRSFVETVTKIGNVDESEVSWITKDFTKISQFTSLLKMNLLW